MAKRTVDNRRVAALRKRIGISFLSYDFARSSGPGGQNVNKVNTQVTLWFDMRCCPALKIDQKETLRRELGGRVTRDGWIRVVSRKHRTQGANKRAATERFYELLAIALAPRKKRIPTRVTGSQKRRRLDEKRRTAAKKQERGSRSIRQDD